MGSLGDRAAFEVEPTLQAHILVVPALTTSPWAQWLPHFALYLKTLGTYMCLCMSCIGIVCIWLSDVLRCFFRCILFMDGTQQCLSLCSKTWFYMCFLSSSPFHLGIPKSGLWYRVPVLGDRCCGMWVLASSVSVHQSCHGLLTTLSPKLFVPAATPDERLSFIPEESCSIRWVAIPLPTCFHPRTLLPQVPVPNISPQAWSGLFSVIIGDVGLQALWWCRSV